MSVFPAEKEERLDAAKAEFREAILTNDLFARIMMTCIESWSVDTNPEIETIMQPCIMPGTEAGMPDVIVGGVQVGFKKTQAGDTKSTSTVWHFIDLFTYRPPKPGYEVMPTTPIISAASEEEITKLINTWKSAIGRILDKFEPHDLKVNRHTGEIDLRENVWEGKMPVLLPID